MNSPLVIVWFLLLAGFVMLEAMTRSLVAVWFMPGTVIGILLAAFHVPFWVQLGQFILLSAALLILTRRFTHRLLPTEPVATNADRAVGELGIVTERISVPDGTGQVKVLGQVWSANAGSPEDVLEAGAEVRVLRIEGVRLIVEAIPNAE